MTFFSVVIPTYNREQLLPETLESLRNQRFKDFEVIVVDDGSIDETCRVCERFEFARLIRQANAGPGAARNRGVAEASGRYVAFLDSDDLWFPHTLEVYHKVISLNEGASFIAGKPFVFQRLGELPASGERPLRSEYFRDYLSSSCEWRWFGVSSFVVRREVFVESGGFRAGLVNGEDAELALRLGCFPGFVQICGPHTFGYRTHPGNVTGDFGRTAEGGMHLVMQEVAGKFPGGSLRAKERRRIIARHLRPVSLQAVRLGRFRDAFVMYRLMFGWQVREGRWKYLLAFPCIAVLWMIRRCISK